MLMYRVAKKLAPFFVGLNFLLSVVAFKTLDISQGSVETHLRCGGIFSDSIITFVLFAFATILCGE